MTELTLPGNGQLSMLPEHAFSDFNLSHYGIKSGVSLEPWQRLLARVSRAPFRHFFITAGAPQLDVLFGRVAVTLKHHASQRSEEPPSSPS